MAFVPSTGGVSHAADETTPDDDLIAGAELLLATLRLADRSAPRTGGNS
jgi:acetylornithine deacetylase/succinyl-diaminopimelate desuccinylase-like protein